MNKVLLDTYAYTRLLSGGSDVLDCISQARIIYLSIFVLGELHAGFAGGSRGQKNREILENFLRKPPVKYSTQRQRQRNFSGNSKPLSRGPERQYRSMIFGSELMLWKPVPCW